MNEFNDSLTPLEYANDSAPRWPYSVEKAIALAALLLCTTQLIPTVKLVSLLYPRGMEWFRTAF